MLIRPCVVSASDDVSPLSLTPEVGEALWRTRSMSAEPSPSPSPEEPAPRRAAEVVDAPAGPVWVPRRTLDKGELEGLMTHFQGHVAAAARHLGMTRPKLYRMLTLHGVEPNGYRPSR